MSFGGFHFGGDPSKLYIDEPTQGALAERPLIATLLANDEYMKTYHGYLEQVATEYLSGDYLRVETLRLFELISEYVRTDPTAFYTYDQFVKSISGTIVGGAMGDENQAEAKPQQQGANNVSDRVSERQGFRMGGAQGFGMNVPGILEFAAEMSESIQKQLSGGLPSTNNGNGMGGNMGMRDRMPNPGGGQRPDQQRDVNFERPDLGGGGRQPGGMLPEGLDRAAMDAFRQEIVQTGGLTDELREKARELGIPDNMIAMLAGGPDGRMPGGMRAERGLGGMRPNNPNGRDAQQNQPIDKTTLTILLVSGVAITAGIIMVSFFKRRRYEKA